MLSSCSTVKLRPLPLLLVFSSALFGELNWRELPPLPEPLGLAGAFVAVEGGALVVAGGASFEVSPFQGGVKRWFDKAYALEAGQWRQVEPLPSPRGYGASVPTPLGTLWIGGSDAERHFSSVLRVRYESGKLTYAQLPALPAPCANLGAARLGDAVYVVCGQAVPSSTRAEKRFWTARLADLVNPVTLPVWREPSLGPGRRGSFRRRGAGRRAVPVQRPSRSRRPPLLSDGYKYKPDTGWAS